jgi:hypothetical protein
LGVSPDHDLLIGRDDPLHQRGVFRRRYLTLASQAAEIVDAFKDDEPAHAGRREHVAIKAGENIGAQAIGKQVVAADALVGDADAARGGRGLKPLRQDIGPAIVAVGGCAVAVSDGVAERYNRGRAADRWKIWRTVASRRSSGGNAFCGSGICCEAPQLATHTSDLGAADAGAWAWRHATASKTLRTAQIFRARVIVDGLPWMPQSKSLWEAHQAYQLGADLCLLAQKS